MKIKESDLTTDRLWRATTGMSKEKFYALFESFKPAYLSIHFKTLEERKVGSSIGYCIQDEKELLLFSLLSLKSGCNYDLLGVFTGMSASNAKRNQTIGLEVLQKSLEMCGCMPKRKFLNVEEFTEFFKDCDELIFDATEHRIQRFNDYELQKDYYSGKAKAHTVKAMNISTKLKSIKYLSHCYAGKIHDYALLKEEFPQEFKWFEKFNIRVDLGYLGIAKDYLCKNVFIPHKKSKNNPLTDEQKAENQLLASERVAVEHSIGGMKRYRCLVNKLRLHDFVLYDVLLGVCAGLWNFYLAN